MITQTYIISDHTRVEVSDFRGHTYYDRDYAELVTATTLSADAIHTGDCSKCTDLVMRVIAVAGLLRYLGVNTCEADWDACSDVQSRLLDRVTFFEAWGPGTWHQRSAKRSDVWSINVDASEVPGILQAMRQAKLTREAA